MWYIPVNSTVFFAGEVVNADFLVLSSGLLLRSAALKYSRILAVCVYEVGGGYCMRWGI